jgi:N4-gp56 family major capsid protein
MAYTGTGDVSSDTAAFQQLAYFAFRSQPMYDMVADVRSTAQTHNGASVQFNIYDNMDQATSALTQDSDVTAVALGDSTVTVTLAEYGNAVITTAKLRGTSFLNVDADAANIIGYNMVDSVDKLVSNVANAGTNVIYSTGSGALPTSRVTIADANTIDTATARQAVAELRGASAPGFENGNYVGLIHPDVSYDLRALTAVTDVKRSVKKVPLFATAPLACSVVSSGLKTLAPPYWMTLALLAPPTFTRLLLLVGRR